MEKNKEEADPILLPFRSDERKRHARVHQKTKNSGSISSSTNASLSKKLSLPTSSLRISKSRPASHKPAKTVQPTDHNTVYSTSSIETGLYTPSTTNLAEFNDDFISNGRAFSQRHVDLISNSHNNNSNSNHYPSPGHSNENNLPNNFLMAHLKPFQHMSSSAGQTAAAFYGHSHFIDGQPHHHHHSNNMMGQQ
jgi:hypothetical protein